MKLYTASQAGRIDKYTIEELGVPSILLMERASKFVAEEAAKLTAPGDDIAVFCGSGNNGGDGVGAAVYLRELGRNVRVFLIGDRNKLTADTSEMAKRFAFLGGSIEDFASNDDITEYTKGSGVIIDAMYGVGFRLPLRDPAGEAARLINSSDAVVIAADIPSGVDASTGKADEDAVRADITVTFSAAKIGHFVTPGAVLSGEVLIRDIGITIPDDVTSDVFAVCDEDVYLPVRARDTHKGNYGRDLIIAGSLGYTGAPSFAARAATRSGAGLVFLGVPSAVYSIEAIKNDEAMVFPLSCDDSGKLTVLSVPEIMAKLNGCDACLIGPGLGLSGSVNSVVTAVLTHSFVPVVVDADGITAVSENIDILDKVSCPIILTPHDGEFNRLSGRLSETDRLSAAREFAAEHNVTVVLKGYRTISAFPDGSVYINTTGNPGMAKGGSGDVLAGMILAFLGQGLDIKKAVMTAVYLHGRAGDICAEKFGEYSMIPSDIIDFISDAMR